MTLFVTANVECTIEHWSQTFYETHTACWLALINHPTCSTSLPFNRSF